MASARIALAISTWVTLATFPSGKMRLLRPEGYAQKIGSSRRQIAPASKLVDKQSGPKTQGKPERVGAALRFAKSGGGRRRFLAEKGVAIPRRAPDERSSFPPCHAHG
jgi:hypothetical protein